MAAAPHRRPAYEQWQEMAPRWEGGRELLWESTRAVSEWLVARLDPQEGQTLLDLAAGTGETGFLAASAIGETGKLISSDLSPNMLEAAKRVSVLFEMSNVEFRLLDIESLELAEASVDGVLCRFGYILKGSPPRALAEIRRVLRPGGRLAFAVWAEREQNAWMTLPSQVMVERGHLQPQSAEETRTSKRRNPEAIARLVRASGFERIEIEEMPISYRFADADGLWFFVSELRGPVALALDLLDENERAVVRAEIEARAFRASDEGFELGGVSLNALAW
jgi:ubiquinone/menaquinone biosynthesis C-methylase UbiE